ncbi:MAG: GtrA family protein [Solirubrobacteraceae bacterium]
MNTGVLDPLCRTAGLWFVTASIVATQVAILFNYGMTERFVFRGRESARTPFSRLVGYVLANNASLLLSAPLLIVLVSALGLGVSVANVISLALLVVVRFVVADRYIWGSKRIGWGKRRRAFAAS